MPLTISPRLLYDGNSTINEPDYISSILQSLAGGNALGNSNTGTVVDPNAPLTSVYDDPYYVGDKPATGGAPPGTGGELQLPAPVDEGMPHDDPTPKPPVTPLTLDQRRTGYLNQARQGFGYNYGRSLVPDDIINGTIQSILDEQRGSAQTYLDRGKARGIYNDVGYGAGLARIGNSAEAGRSQLSTMGSDVLNRYRGQANSVRDDAYSTISGLLDGQDFSLDPYFAEGQAIGDTARHNAGGDLRTTLGGQNFFDFTGIGNAAGAAQGAINNGDTSITSALADRSRRKSQGRGLGSTGVF